MQRWEYKAVVILRPRLPGQEADAEHELNELGAQGWEAIGVSIPGPGDASNHALVILKRPIA